jgi:hypothetical protein
MSEIDGGSSGEVLELKIRLDDLAVSDEPNGDRDCESSRSGQQHTDIDEDDGDGSEVHTELEISEDEMDGEEGEEGEGRHFRYSSGRGNDALRLSPRYPATCRWNEVSHGDSDEIDYDGNGGDITARPVPGMSFWNGLGASIDEMMSTGYRREQDQAQPRSGSSHTQLQIQAQARTQRPDMTLTIPQQKQQQRHRETRFSRLSRGSGIQRLDPVSTATDAGEGPTTPNGYDDISPVTRGEWGFLFKGEGWKGARTAAVETC